MVYKYVECPNCGYTGVIKCIQALGYSGEQCICPDCEYHISDLKKP